MKTAVGKKGSLDILLAEDNIADRELFETLLAETRFPCALQIVSDGEAATDFLFRRGVYSKAPRPDLIILDINLPRKNGFEVLSELREHQGDGDLPVIIILTTSCNLADIKRGRDLGAREFLTKSPDLAGFREIVRRLTTVEFPKYLIEKKRPCAR